MSDVIKVSVDDKQKRRRALAAALLQSRDAERALIEHDRHEDAEQEGRLAAEIGSVVRPR